MTASLRLGTLDVARGIASKVHLIDEYGMKQFRRPVGAVCGKRPPFINIGRNVVRDRLVNKPVFECLPRQAQCGSCAWKPKSANEEQILSVEAALHAIARVWT